MRPLRSLRRGELISAGSAVALLVVLFGFAWYGVAGVPDPTRAQPAIPGTETGWQGLSLVRWVLVLTALAAVAALAVHAGARGRGAHTETGGAMLVLGLISSLLLLWRVLIQLPSPDKVTDQKLGALLGLACALGIALGGHESLTELRDRRRNARPVEDHRPPAAPREPSAAPTRASAPAAPAAGPLVAPRDAAAERPPLS